MIFLMNISTGTFGFDATFEASIVTIVRCILDTQIINTTIWLEIHSAKINEKEEKETRDWEKSFSESLALVCYFYIKSRYEITIISS